MEQDSTAVDTTTTVADAPPENLPSSQPENPASTNGNEDTLPQPGTTKRKREDTDVTTTDQHQSSDEEHEDVLEINLDELEDETRCSVCLSIINNTRLVSVCMHRFCAACIETWLRNSKSNSCPACRKPLQSRRDCKPDPRFDELLRLLYGSVEEYEADVVMPLAAEATRVNGWVGAMWCAHNSQDTNNNTLQQQQAKEMGRVLRQQAIIRKQKEGPLTQAELRVLHGGEQRPTSTTTPAHRNTTPPPRKQPRTIVPASVRQPVSTLPQVKPPVVAVKPERERGPHARRMMPTRQARTEHPLVPVSLQLPEGVVLERAYLQVSPLCTLGVIKAYLREKLPAVQVCWVLCCESGVYKCFVCST